VVEGSVDHCVRLRRTASEAAQICQRAALDLRARRGECFRSLIRTGQAKYLVSGADQVIDDG